METVQLSVEVRQGSGKGVARKIRAKGKVPGIIYGKGMGQILIEVNPRELLAAISSKAGMNALIDLQIPQQEKITAILKDYQADNITRDFTHLDFLKLDLSKKFRVEVPVRIVGKAEGVKEGGILEVIRREITVSCLPTAIPKSIEIDVSALKVGESLHINEIKFPAGIEVPHDVDFAIVSVVAPKEEVIAATEATPAEPEVLTAKKPAEGSADAKAEGKKSDKK